MAEAKFVITDSTGQASVWEESSPQDPTTVTVEPYGTQTITSNSDNGPWTVRMSQFGGAMAEGGVILNHSETGTTAYISLSDGSAGIFNVQV